MQGWGIPKIFFVYLFVVSAASFGGLRADQRVLDQVAGPAESCPKKIMSLAENPVYQGLHAVIPEMAGTFGKTKLFEYGVQPLIEAAMSLKGLAHLYAEAIQMDPKVPFSDRMLKTVNISHSVNEGGLNSIPKTGPLLLVSNHPFGIADGLLLLNLVRKVRKDVKIISTTALKAIPELTQEDFILVDVHGDQKSAATKEVNSKSLRKILKTMKTGGVIIVFPAGAVSRYRKDEGKITELDWKPDILKIALMTDADILPVFVEGRNSPWFQLGARIHRKVASTLLIREFINKSGRLIRIQVGEVQKAETLKSRFDLERPENLKNLAAYLRDYSIGLSQALDKEGQELLSIP